MTFDYLERVIVEGQLDVENIGQCIIEGNNDIGEFWYLFIKTELGWSEIIDYGPHLPDFDLLHPNFQIKYSRIEYNEGKIERTIDKFLNDPKRVISQARVVELSDIEDIEFINPVYKVFPKNEVNRDE